MNYYICETCGGRMDESELIDDCCPFCGSDEVYDEF
jgi:RNA polymerase subunit RPABC4/transcription elongation factor Spt4